MKHRDFKVTVIILKISKHVINVSLMLTNLIIYLLNNNSTSHHINNLLFCVKNKIIFLYTPKSV